MDKRLAYWLAILLIASQFLLLLLRPFPVMMDDWYHISVIRAVYERQGVQLWNDWEFAPYGRPHLYPPLFHAAGATLGVALNAVFALGTQGSILSAFLFLKAVSYPLLLFSVWWLSRKLFSSEEAALYSLLLVMGVFAIFFAAEVILPSAFALALLNFLAFFFAERRKVASVLLLAAIAYTHMGIFLVAQLFILVYSLIHRKDGYLAQFAVVEAASLALYAPWLAHILLNAGWFQSVGMAFGLALPLVVWLPALACVLLAGKQTKKPVFLLLAYAAALLPLLFSYGHRFWIYIALPLSVLGGYAITRIRSRLGKAVVCAVIVSSLFYAPTIYDNESVTRYFSPTTMMGGFLVESPLSIEFTKLRILDSPLSMEERETAAWVGSNTGKGDIIMASHFQADVIYALTGRRASGGSWAETAPAWLLEKSVDYDNSALGLLVCEERDCPANANLVATAGRLQLRKR